MQPIQDKATRFYFPWFPRLQIGLALLFAAASLLGPLLIRRLDWLILITTALGLLLGLVTLRIGWRAAVEKLPVGYPFAAWSARILNALLPPGQADASTPARRAGKKAGPPAVSRRLLLLGWANLVLGGALVLGILVFCYITFGVG